MPKTIKECLENLASDVESEHTKLMLNTTDTAAYILTIDTLVDTALAEIRQALKECEPEIKLPESFNFGNNNTIREYTANIEKRLG